jgi:hypothetical protein
MRKAVAIILIVSGGLSIGATAMRAQSNNDGVARVALVLTPVGSLPPLATSTIQAEVQQGLALAVRYGYLPGTNGGSDANNAGATAIIPFGLGGTVSLTAGFFAYTCDGCDPGLMLSLGGDRRLGDLALGSERDGSRLQFALNGELGYGQPQRASFSTGSVVSGAVGVPISLISGSRARNEMRIVPFVTPGFGFGGIRGPESSSGTALMIGGGIGIYNRSNSIAFNLGFQHVAVQDAGTQIGLALVLGGR